MRLFFIGCISLLLQVVVTGQSITGNITDGNGEPLPYTAVYIQSISRGTTSTIEGKYELKVAPGSYSVSFKHLGFVSQVKQVEVTNKATELDVVMRTQSYLLQTAEVKGDTEDPAYTIMRRAIAKAKYHALQLDAYNSKVYIKGTGQVQKIPWLLRSKLAEEGIDTNKVYTSESISEIYYERPNTYREKVISMRVSGPNDNTGNPNSYIQGSFYEPLVVGSVSPLSPSAFRYYRFEYLGSFFEGEQEVNKIAVRPRSAGEKLFEGTLYIRDDHWNIHSLALRTYIEGFKVEINQIYRAVATGVWMPTNQQINFSGSLFGFQGYYNYVAVINDYQVTVNPDLKAEFEVIDEKIEEVPDSIINQTKSAKLEQLNPEQQNKLTRKQLRKLIRTYEKEEEKAIKKEARTNDDVVVSSNYTFEVDSAAKVKDSAYWEKVRPVPLTEKEKLGYQQADSAYEQAEVDTVRRNEMKKFSLGDVLTGNSYSITKRTVFNFDGLLPQLRFNTVEGFNASFAGDFSWIGDTTLHLEVRPEVRYGLASDDVYYQAQIGGYVGNQWSLHRFRVKGGRYINQFLDESISPFVNSIYTLMLTENYMRLYAEDYGDLSYTWSYAFKSRLSANLYYGTRYQLANTTDQTWFNPGDLEIQSNEPQTIGKEQPLVEGTTMRTDLEWRIQPWMKYAERNGSRRPYNPNTTEFRFKYSGGWNGLAESTADFQQLELGIKAQTDLGIRATLHLQGEVGSFLSNDEVQFADFKHFQGGQTELAPISLTGNYRLLPYYTFSTNQDYAAAFAYVNFRKFAVTQFPLARFAGLQEQLFINHLSTTNNPEYTEVGYTLDKIFRFFRVELVHSFIDGEPQDFGFRIGASTLVSFD